MCGQDSVSDFDRLRAAVGCLGSRDAFLYAFDLLEIDGDDLRDVRRETLTSLLRKARDGIRQLRLDVLKDIEADPMSTATDVRRRLQSHAPLSTARCRPCIFLSC